MKDARVLAEVVREAPDLLSAAKIVEAAMIDSAFVALQVATDALESYQDHEPTLRRSARLAMRIHAIPRVKGD